MNNESTSERRLRIASDKVERECDEATIYRRCLPLAGARILELGCGAAQHTVAIAALNQSSHISAYEVDRLQHENNLATISAPNISFKLAGAQDITEADASFDIVMMFKSLHHVPLDFLGQALREINRVLKPGGHAYFSEPVFAGEFNEILRLFHDEQIVRRAAFGAICDAVADGLFEVAEQVFFAAPVRFIDFADFERKIIKATHSNHQLSDETYLEVKSRMEAHLGDGGIQFSAPMRIDLLRKRA